MSTNSANRFDRCDLVGYEAWLYPCSMEGRLNEWDSESRVYAHETGA